MIKTQLERDAAFVLSDLKKNGSQDSWDWSADGRFAVYCGDVELAGLIVHLMDSSSVSAIRMGIHSLMIRKPITERRLRALRALVKRGKVKACWLGTGAGALSSFGTNRTRQYRLSK